MPENNSYFAQLNRIAEALENLGAFRNALAGQTFDFATDFFSSRPWPRFPGPPPRPSPTR